MLTHDDYVKWLKTCLSAGLPAMSIDTAARIMAVLYEYGNNEGFTFNQRFIADKDYIQERFGLKAMKVPDPEFVSLRRHNVKELQEYQLKHRSAPADKEHPHRCLAPDWAPRLLKERYNMKFIG